MNKFKKRTLKVIAEHLTIDEVADIRDLFDKLDVRHVGEITFDELKDGLRKAGHNIPNSDALILMDAADVDGSGTLDIGEFMAVAIHIQKIGNDEHIRKAFAFFDSDHSGFIEIEELKEHLAHDLGTNHEEIINAIICDVDTDKDGKISYQEFEHMMKAGTDWRKVSRHYSRERFNSLSWQLRQDGAVQIVA